jgi:hypothetical protein
MNGQFSANLQENLANGGIGIGKIDAAGAPYASKIPAILAGIKSGKIKPPTTILVK